MANPARTFAVIQWWLESLSLDARLALRMLARHRGLTTVAASSIALGIAVNLSVFSFVNAVFLSPVPGALDTASLVTVHQRTRSKGSFTGASYPDYSFYRQHVRSLSGVIASTEFTASVRAGDSLDRLTGELVSDNYFEVLGTCKVLGPR